MTKAIEDQYQKKTPIEHVLLRPDTYVGSVETETHPAYTIADGKIVQKSISYVPGLYKIFDEILVNAADNKVRDPSMTCIRVEIENDFISVFNDGKGIPIVLHKKENVYVPELIFGQLLTSSNYDDKEKKITGGRNGYGAKLCNIFSETFIVETCDGSKWYRQEFKKNMSTKTDPEVVDLSSERGREITTEINALLNITKKRGNKTEFTKIKFKPDLKRFGMTTLDEEFLGLVKRRIYDMAGVVRNIDVYLNNELIPIKTFKDYCALYTEAELTYYKIDRWEVCIGVSNNSFQQVSFVNSICTSKGGTHIQHVLDQVMDGLIDHVHKKEKVAIKPPQVKSCMFVFICTKIENPSFDSQTKECLTLATRKFGSKCSPMDLKNLLKNTALMSAIVNAGKAKQSAQLKKTDGAKTSRLSGIPKLDDANMAGTKQSSRCTLILTEGDSAKALAVSGLSVVGRDFYGVFPLRGKLLNVRDASHKQIMENAEICAIKKILGLQHGKEYKTVEALRYGHVLIMTDQDHDGSHIKGLLINFFDHFFPDLLRVDGFMQEFITPIVRATYKNEVIDFFNLPEYENWKKTVNEANYKIKYYKGLGTSTSKDAKLYFTNLQRHVKTFTPLSDEDRGLLSLAFAKKAVDQRKTWLKDFVPGTFLDSTTQTITISDFVNKELILFSMADNIRSIPSVVDGLKPGQRKVLFACFKRKLHAEIKVAQLAGYISEHSAYHHGEQSLCSTIVNLAQNFVGSNNIPLLMPQGQFGTRLQGGKDAASARYIFTFLNPLTRLIYHIDDDFILDYINEDNQSIEPQHYVPIIPMVLVNGVEGIGTGWSTSIPNYDPKEIVVNIKLLLENREMKNMSPSYRGFKGELELIPGNSIEIPSEIIEIGTAEVNPQGVVVIGDEKEKKKRKIQQPQGNRYTVSGIYNISGDTIDIDELPIGVWTQTYKEFLDSLVGTEIKDFKDHSTENSVRFQIKVADRKINNSNITKKLKLMGSISTNNFVCFDKNGLIKKYSGPEEIIKDFYTLRLEYYSKRKEFLINKLYNELLILENKVRFIQYVIEDKIKLKNQQKKQIESCLEQLKFAQHESSYDYLLNMPLLCLTLERIEKLNKERGEKEAEYTALLKKSIKELWIDDLDAFLVAYEDFLKKDDPQDKKNTKGKLVDKKKKPQVVKKKAWEKYGIDFNDSD